MSTPYELDHVFICVDVGAPEAELLVKFGLTEGSPNTHPGQGTANRRFFFGNSMIELFYVTDTTEANSASVRRTGLLQRWQRRRVDASPFGVCIRPGQASPGKPPFSAWAYQPSFFTAPVYLGTNCHRFKDPLLFYMPFGRKPNAREQPLEHEVGFQEITALRIKGPSFGDGSSELKEMIQTGFVEFVATESAMMKIGFDGEKFGKSHEFSPTLPLTFCW